jgi:hypothetical protein
MRKTHQTSCTNVVLRDLSRRTMRGGDDGVLISQGASAGHDALRILISNGDDGGKVCGSRIRSTNYVATSSDCDARLGRGQCHRQSKSNRDHEFGRHCGYGHQGNYCVISAGQFLKLPGKRLSWLKRIPARFYVLPMADSTFLIQHVKCSDM